MQKISLEDEVNNIQKYYENFENDHKTVVEINAERWVKLGIMLAEHQQHVVANGKKWEEWVIQHFLFLKERRRQQAMALTVYKIETLRPYFYLGFDRLYCFFILLKNYMNEPDLQALLKEFGFSSSPEIDGEDKSAEIKKSVDQVMEFYKFKSNCKNMQYDYELLKDVIKTGTEFSSSEFTEIQNRAKNGQSVDDFLLNKLIAGTTGSGGQSSSGKVGIIPLLAMLIQTVDGYISDDEIPVYLPQHTVNLCHDRLTWLREKCNNN
jgi:hypothetical protein